MATEESELERRAGLCRRVRWQLQRGAELDQARRHPVTAVDGGLVQGCVVPIWAVGRVELRARGDERTRLGGVVRVPGDIVELSVESGGGGGVAVGGRRAEIEAAALAAIAAELLA